MINVTNDKYGVTLELHGSFVFIDYVDADQLEHLLGVVLQEHDEEKEPHNDDV